MPRIFPLSRWERGGVRDMPKPFPRRCTPKIETLPILLALGLLFAACQPPVETGGKYRASLTGLGEGAANIEFG